MKKLIKTLLVVYFLVSWKEYKCDSNCALYNYFIPTTNLGSSVVTPTAPANGSCSIKVVIQSKQFDTEEQVAEFVKSINLKPFEEEMLDNPSVLKWGFKKTKITHTEKEEELLK